MFANRLAKNLKRLRPWAEREGISCFRIYDADMPEYAFAIDLYGVTGPEATWLYAQEYAAPAEIEREAVQRRRGEVLASLAEVTGVNPERTRVRTRRRTRRGEQYLKVGGESRFHTVLEGGLRLRVNTSIPVSSSTIASRVRDCARQHTAGISSTCSLTPARQRCTPRTAGPAAPRASTCRRPILRGRRRISRSMP